MYVSAVNKICKVIYLIKLISTAEVLYLISLKF